MVSKPDLGLIYGLAWGTNMASGTAWSHAAARCWHSLRSGTNIVGGPGGSTMVDPATLLQPWSTETDRALAALTPGTRQVGAPCEGNKCGGGSSRRDSKSGCRHDGRSSCSGPFVAATATTGLMTWARSAACFLCFLKMGNHC